MANKRDSQQQQSKKPSSGDNKKANENEDGAIATSSAPPSDVYEFVSTPKHSSCSSGSGDENPSKNSDKSSDEKSGAESDTPTAGQSQKRALGEQQESNEESQSQADEDAKRKKRKDSELKEANKASSSAGNRVASRVGQKPPGPASKTMGLVSKSNSCNSAPERKSPTELLAKSPESEMDTEDGKDGPKVPPLKIVIPPSGGTEQQEASQIANQRISSKATTSRNHPYVVASSNSNDGAGSDKDGGGGGRSQSPSAESNKSDDTSKSTGKSKEPRILRSSRKDAKDDRGSNNSSPQLPASSTPSPANQNMETSTGNESENQQSSQNPASSSSISSSTTTSSTVTSSTQNTSQATQLSLNPVELHPRKRKIKASSREPSAVASSADIKDANSKDGQEKAENIHPHDQPFTNCYQMYIDLKKQIEQRHRNLHPVEPRPLKGLEDYLMNRRTYLLQGKNTMEPNIIIPPLLPSQMKETFTEQEKERHKLKLRHIVEKEKLVLSKEQEILRVHCKAAQMIANQSQPFSVSTILKDEEVYNIITPEQEEKYRNKNRERSHGRVFYQALKELDDKYDKIKVELNIARISHSYSHTYLIVSGSNDHSSHK